MSWSIPSVPPSQRPEAIKLYIWLPIFVVIMGIGAAAVLLFWPQDRSTHTPKFWLLLVGAPASVCAVLFGMMLTRWERQQIVAEESEREAARLAALWRAWARHHLGVVRAVAFLPTVQTAEQLVAGEVAMPVNLQRSVGFYWGEKDKADIRRDRFLGLVVDRFADDLANVRSLEVVLILDGTSQAGAAQWKAESGRLLAEALPGIACDIRVADATSCVARLEANLGQDQMPAQLIVAAQIWADAGENTFSEGGAAILLSPRTAGRSVSGVQLEELAGRICRPMTSQTSAMADDVSTMLNMQVAPDSLQQVWSSGLNRACSTAMLSALSTGGADSPTVVQLENALGVPGPVSGWMALALALEAARHGKAHQLVAWQESDAERVHLCVVAPVQPGGA